MVKPSRDCGKAYTVVSRECGRAETEVKQSQIRDNSTSFGVIVINVEENVVVEIDVGSIESVEES